MVSLEGPRFFEMRDWEFLRMSYRGLLIRTREAGSVATAEHIFISARAIIFDVDETTRALLTTSTTTSRYSDIKDRKGPDAGPLGLSRGHFLPFSQIRFACLSIPKKTVPDGGLGTISPLSHSMMQRPVSGTAAVS